MSGKIFDLTPESEGPRHPVRRSASFDYGRSAEEIHLARTMALERAAVEALLGAQWVVRRRAAQGQGGGEDAVTLALSLRRHGVGEDVWEREVRRVVALQAEGTAYLARKREERLRRQAAEAAASISLPAASMSEAGVLQAQAEVGREGGALSPALSGRIGAKRGGGQPLEATVRRGMEGVFGVDFSPVRIHADPEADALNRGVAAIAFTVGSDIFFRAGFYQPRTPAGQHLLAHELTHVVQQRTGSLGASGGGNAGGGTMTVGAADDRHEQEAEATAHRVTAALQARGQALTAPATSPGAALSRAHDPAVALAPAAPGIARAVAPPSWPAPPVNKTGLVPLAVPVLAAARVIPQPLPVGAPVLLLGHDGAGGGSGWSYVRLVAQPWAGREGWLSSAMVKLTPAPAAPRSVAPRRVPAPAVVFNDGGVHLYAQPSTAQTQAPLLPWNTTLTVDAYLPPDAAHKDQAGWCHVTTPAGQRGYVNSGYLDYDLPDPQAKLLKIQAHDTAEIIVKKAGYRFAHGRDARYYINVLVSVNKPGTLYNPDPHPEQVDHWKKTVAVVNETIWLPGQAFADSLTGVVGSGSITGGAWAALQQGLGWAEVHVLQTAALSGQALGIVGDAAANAAHYALTSGGAFIASIPRAVGPAAVAALQAVAALETQPAALIVALGKAVAGAVLHQLPPQLVALLEQQAQELIMGVLGPDVRRVLGDARDTLALILANPVAFLTHLGEALARGFGQFRDHLWPDLQSGVVTWLARQLGLDAPDGTGFTLDATGLLSLGLDALGLTYAAFRGKVVDRLTAEKVGHAEALVRAVEAGAQGVPALLTTLKRQGLAATWRTLLARVGASMDSLIPAALGAVRDWVAQRLVQ